MQEKEAVQLAQEKRQHSNGCYWGLCHHCGDCLLIGWINLAEENEIWDIGLPAHQDEMRFWFPKALKSEGFAAIAFTILFFGQWPSGAIKEPMINSSDSSFQVLDTTDIYFSAMSSSCNGSVLVYEVQIFFVLTWLYCCNSLAKFYKGGGSPQLLYCNCLGTASQVTPQGNHLHKYEKINEFKLNRDVIMILQFSVDSNIFDYVLLHSFALIPNEISSHCQSDLTRRKL